MYTQIDKYQPSRSRQSLRRRYLPVLALWLGLCGTGPALQAQDALEPVFETLPYLQKAAALRAAPSGFDAPLPETVVPMQVAPDEPLTGESSLEKLADEKSRELSLRESATTQQIDEPLQQFGYDIFSAVPSTFAPIENIPVPADYRIASGDTLVVQLYGKRNVEYRLVVTREGKLLIPEYGPLDVAGLNFSEVKDLVVDGFERRVIGARAVVTMGELRALQVRLTGDVVKPGVYTIGALSTLVDALLATGGIKHTGSLRDVQVRRSGELVTRFDLYDLLLKGDASHDIGLQHNDVIFIPAIGDIVYVGGEVQRPGIYELRGEKTLQQVLQLVGGLTASASLQDSVIERIIPGRFRTLVSLGGSKPLQERVVSGDFLRILPVDDSLDAVVLLSGHVKRPGGYQLREGMRVSQLVPDSRVLLSNADLDFALVKREQAGTRRSEIIYVDLAAAMQRPGTAADLLLQARDELIILHLDSNRARELAGLVRELDIQATDYRPAATVTLTGHVRFSGRLPLQRELRLVDVLAVGGGIRRGTDTNYGVLARTRHPQGEVVMRSFSLARALALPDSSDNPLIEPGDRLYLFDQRLDRSALMNSDLQRLEQQGDYTAVAPIVRANGRVNHPGRYPLEPGMRASDLLCAARGLTEKGYGIKAELTRYRTALSENREVDQWPLDTRRLIQLCSEQRSKAADVGVRELQRRAASWGRVKTSDQLDDDYLQRQQLARLAGSPSADSSPLSDLYNDDSVNPLLQADDQLTFVGKPGWVENARVELHGEITRPGVYVIDRGESLCSVMQRAGGVTASAYLPGASFTRRSIMQQQQQTLDGIQDRLDDLMVDLSLSHSYNNADKTPAGERKDEYLRVIKQLERARPSGRMVIDLEEAMTCNKRFDVALVDGDRLEVGVLPNTVYVSGQVYVPTSHLHQRERTTADYLDLSGGVTVLGREQHAYVIGPNGEVLAGNSSSGYRKLMRKRLQPGSTVIVPLDVDRMNPTEKAQSWTRSLVEIAILAGIVL